MKKNDNDKIIKVEERTIYNIKSVELGDSISELCREGWIIRLIQLLEIGDKNVTINPHINTQLIDSTKAIYRIEAYKITTV